MTSAQWVYRPSNISYRLSSPGERSMRTTTKLSNWIYIFTMIIAVYVVLIIIHRPTKHNRHDEEEPHTERGRLEERQRVEKEEEEANKEELRNNKQAGNYQSYEYTSNEKRVDEDGFETTEERRVLEPYPPQGESTTTTPETVLFDVSGTYLARNQTGVLLSVERLLDKSPLSLADRLKANVIPGEKRVILSWYAGHEQAHLGGCPDWNCEFTTNLSRAAEASVIIMAGVDTFVRRSPDQYVVFKTAESPRHFGFTAASSPDFFNASMTYMHGQPSTTPYGYTIKLAQPRPYEKVVNRPLLDAKNNTIAWFVSHCDAPSKRFELGRELMKLIRVDAYGRCFGRKEKCSWTDCLPKLTFEYHFYLAFENSVCTDYMTEKLWHQGYQYIVVPIVLKRSIVEPFVPPHSFIAVDDFPTLYELVDHLNYLMANKTAYAEYFAWRQYYITVLLDGDHHDVLERPWGFCQLCRMAWQEPKERYVIDDVYKYWFSACENDGDAVYRILEKTRLKSEQRGLRTIGKYA